MFRISSGTSLYTVSLTSHIYMIPSFREALKGFQRGEVDHVALIINRPHTLT